MFLVLDHIFGASCKLLHVTSGNALSSLVPQLFDHFSRYGSPVMMGGDVDAASKGILGIACNEKQENVHFLVLDPHFTNGSAVSECTKKDVQNQLFVKWMPLSSFDERSFYNLCCPCLMKNK